MSIKPQQYRASADLRRQHPPTVSVVILTLNEAANLPDCLATCGWCDDVHVLDSGSDDNTRELGGQLGAMVHVHPFESFGAQRNWAIDNIPLRHDWVFHLDADERFTPELVDELRRSISDKTPEAGFHVPAKLIFMDRWLRRSGGYPTYQMRLFHRQRMRFTDYGHGQREMTDGMVGRLDQPYLHYNFSKGIEDWIEKHNRYSTLEASQILATVAERLHPMDLASSDPVRRRRALKRLWYRTPCRPLLRFLAMMVRGGALEGGAGRCYASLMALYERMINLKIKVILASRQTSAHTPPRKD